MKENFKEKLLLSIALDRLKGVSLKDKKVLLEKFESINDLSQSNLQKLSNMISIKSLEPLGKLINYEEDAYDYSRKFLEDNESLNIKIISIFDAFYPDKLKNVQGSPLNLYVKGNVELLSYGKSVAVVGTRKASKKGLEIANQLCKLLSKSGFMIISGLAEGIDTESHKSSLANNGKTVAVVATDLKEESIYPKSNLGLSKEILDSEGTLISEVPLDSPPTKQRFLLRNRIQSALSMAVAVIETGETGGTLHTIRFAESQRKALICPKLLNEFDKELVPENIKEKFNFVFDENYEGVIDFLESYKFTKPDKNPDDETRQISMF